MTARSSAVAAAGEAVEIASPRLSRCIWLAPGQSDSKDHEHDTPPVQCWGDEMPIAQSNGCPIHYEVEGDASKPALMFCNSLGTTLHMWDGQMPAILEHFRVVRYDRRGHGKSGVPAGPYSMEMLGRDALAVLDAAKVDKTNWCGLSMGGMVGMWLGANAPQRVNRLILSNTAAYFENKQIWNDRIALVKEKGLT